MPTRRFTGEELGRYTGRDGAPTFGSCKGRVHDVSGSFLWKDGRHQAIDDAGGDLSGSLDDAPHGADVLERFPMVGTLDGD
jgi:predicted heme/steroid binding protein